MSHRNELQVAALAAVLLAACDGSEAGSGGGSGGSAGAAPSGGSAGTAGNGVSGGSTSAVTLSCGSLGKAGTVRWVSPTGTAAWNACVGTTPLGDTAACSLATANTNAAAGDTVYLRGGTYSTAIVPRQAGTLAAGITFQNADGEAVHIRNVAVAIDVKSLSYVTLDGIAADTVDYWLRLDGSDHICVFNGTFTDLRSNTQGNWPSGLVIANSSHHNWVKNCSAGGIGYALTDCSGPCAIGGMFLGDWEIGPPYDQSSYNLIEENTFYHGGTTSSRSTAPTTSFGTTTSTTRTGPAPAPIRRRTGSAPTGTSSSRTTPATSPYAT